MKKINYINTDEGIQEFAEHISNNSIKMIALDFEGESNLYRYGLHLCLIQIYDGKKYFIIDPIANIDLDPVKSILEDEKIVKVMCAPDFDVKLLKVTRSVCIKSIYDVQLAAKMLGEQQVSYKNLVEVVSGVELTKSKKKQKANWNKRPIKEDLINYAIEDVQYLFDILEHYEKMLRSTNRWEQFLADCKKLEQVEISNGKPSFNNVKGIGALTPQQRHILRIVFNERERIAKSIDKPVFYLFPNRALIELVKNYPKSEKSWDKFLSKHPFSKKFKNRFMRLKI